MKRSRRRVKGRTDGRGRRRRRGGQSQRRRKKRRRVEGKRDGGGGGGRKKRWRKRRRKKRWGRRRWRRKARKSGFQIVCVDTKQRRAQRYCCHISGQHLPTAALSLSRVDITSNGFKVLNRHPPSPHLTLPSCLRPLCRRSGGGAESPPAGTSACGHPQSISICSPPPPLCSFFPISEPLEVIGTLECEELSPRMRLAAAGGRHVGKTEGKKGWR